MTAPVQTPDTPEVLQQRESVNRCLLALALAFDVPCGCGHRSDLCTMRDDGTCDG